MSLADDILYAIGKTGLGTGEAMIWKDGQAVAYLNAVNHETGERWRVIVPTRLEASVEVMGFGVGL